MITLLKIWAAFSTKYFQCEHLNKLCSVFWTNYLECESLVEDWVQSFAVYFCLILLLLVRQEVHLDVGVGRPTHVHAGKISGLYHTYWQLKYTGTRLKQVRSAPVSHLLTAEIHRYTIKAGKISGLYHTYWQLKYNRYTIKAGKISGLYHTYWQLKYTGTWLKQVRSAPVSHLLTAEIHRYTIKAGKISGL